MREKDLVSGLVAESFYQAYGQWLRLQRLAKTRFPRLPLIRLCNSNSNDAMS